MKIYRGEVLSEGLAIGKPYFGEVKYSTDKNFDVGRELELLNRSLTKSKKQLKNLILANDENRDLLVVQLLIVEDKELKTHAIKLIEEGNSAFESIDKVLNLVALNLEKSSNTYLQQRSTDILDVKQRLLKNINSSRIVYLKMPRIYCSEELWPSFLIQNKKNILGVITLKGGYSSHSAILCRQLNIPYIKVAELPKNFESVIIDTRKQQLIFDPDEDTVKHYTEVIEKLSKEVYVAVEHPNIGFYANVCDNSELEKVLNYGFDGIGLYRTEMIFMNTNRPLSYEEQLEIYSEAVEKMGSKAICFRTYDIGDDKQLSYVATNQKGLANYLANPELFETQIKALLVANKYDNLKIMFPMLNSYQEFKFLKNWVLRIKKEIANNSKIQLGMMLETKAAMEDIESFENVDFISIGTNDLVLSVYHINRDLQKQQLKSYIDDLVAKIAYVAAVCNRKKIFLTVCGELAAIDVALRYFIKAGIKNFSVATPAIKILNYIYKEQFVNNIGKNV